MAEWYYKIAEQVVGPMSAEQLKALAGGGRLAPGDPVAQSTEGPWVPASRVKGLFDVAAIDDEPAEKAPPPAPVPPVQATEQGPVGRPVEEPPIPQPPVVLPAAATSQPPLSQPAGPATDTGLPPSAPVGGFAIHTEEVAATERFQKKKRAKREREPLTKKQKNARLVKRLAIAVVLGGLLLFCIPYLRSLPQSVPESEAAPDPITSDVDIGTGGDGLEDALGALSQAGRVRSKPSGTMGGGDSAVGVEGEPVEQVFAAPKSADMVEVKPVRVVLDRPQVFNAAGDPFRLSNRFLLVELELKAKASDGSPRFRGWIDYAKEISLTDDHGVRYEVRVPQNFRGMFVEGQCREMVFLSADEPTTDVVVFAWPEDEAPDLPSNSEEALKLRLPRAAYGGQGELRFAIPLSQIEVTEKGLEKPRGEPPAAMPGTSDNVEEDDGRPIRIPGLMD